jgi:hypothetical protein
LYLRPDPRGPGLCILTAAAAAATPRPPTTARLLPPPARQQLACDALAGFPITDLARQHDVSRKFVSQQLHRAHDALDQAFAPPPADPPAVLFWLPVTKPWIRQLVLGLTLICHSSLRGVTELLQDLVDLPRSVGTAHHILQPAVATARSHNDRHDLSRVRIGAHDESFQAGRPVLVGADADSTYCYLLRSEEHRDADTWGVRLLELADRGFHPEATIADGASGLRAGQALALPGVPCRGDVFHALNDVGPLVRYLENRAYGAITARTKLERQQAAAERRHGRKKPALSQKLHAARLAEARAIALAEEVALLARWLREDIRAVAGPDHARRRELFSFVVAELRAREASCPHRIGPVRRLLENQRDDLLAFAVVLDRELAAVAAEWQVGVAAVREVLSLQALAACDPRRWQREAAVRQALRGRYHGVSEAVAELVGRVVRASSVIENLNRRLRGYFFLRRQLGEGYQALLQFFLNPRRFPRSEQAERVGKSPSALLTGEPHAHWLELLGYTRFSRV